LVQQPAGRSLRTNEGRYDSSLRGVDAPFVARFTFTVDGMNIGKFMEVSGLSAEIDVETVTEGGQNQYEHKLPGRMKWPNLVLKRGITDTDELNDWFLRMSGIGFGRGSDRISRSTGALSLLMANGNVLRSWEFDGAFPVKWTGPSFSASGSDVATEELEIAHNGFKPKSGV
jgi:phage tail-like protein